jgi:5-methylcytosine-specific restriction endonuclease McrA
LIIHRREEKVRNWLETGDTGFTVDTTIRGAIRDYILQSQNKQCAICGMLNEWNGTELNFVLDHIDGDASNSSRDNLRLVCPNCDSQLPTFKSRNKNSARNKRKEFLHETVERLSDK